MALTETIKGFPNPFASAEEKATKEYGIYFGRAMHGLYVANLVSINEQRLRWKMNTKYAEGLQTTDLVKTRFTDEDTTSWLNLDYSAPSILAARVDTLLGRMNEAEYEVGCEITDELGARKQDEHRQEMETKMFLKPLSDHLQKITGIPLVTNNSPLPNDNEELQMYMDMDFVQAESTAMQTIIESQLSKNKYRDFIEERLKRDLIVNKRCAIISKIDKHGCIKIERGEPVDIITPYSKRDDFYNIDKWGIIQKYTIQQIACMTDEFTEQDLFNIAKRFAGTEFGNPGWNNGWNSYSSYEGYYQNTMRSRPFNDFLISVLEFEFIAINSDVYTDKTTPAGAKHFEKRDANYMPPAATRISDEINRKKKEAKKLSDMLSQTKNQDKIDKYKQQLKSINQDISDLSKKLSIEKSKDVETDDFSVIRKTVNYRYSGSWIINSDYIYSYGMDKNIQREKDSQGNYSSETPLSLTMIAPNIYDSENKSLVERAITHVSQIALIRTKIQQLYMKSIPPGFFIDLDAIDNVIKGKGGKVLSVEQAVKMFMQNGSGVFRRRTPDGKPMNGDPIKIMPNGLPPGMEQLFYAIAQEIAALDNVMGLNDATNAATPSPDAAVGVQQNQIMGTGYAIQGLVNAFTKVSTNMVNNVALMIQDKIEYDEDDDLIGEAGINAVEQVKAAKNIPLHKFGISIKYLPTAQDKQAIENDITEALKTSAIEIGDAIQTRLLLKRDTNKAVRYLLYKIKKNKEQKAKESQALQAQNGQVQMQSAQAAEQAKQSTLTLEYQLKGQLAQQQHKFKMEELAITGEYAIKGRVVTHDSQVMQMALENAINSDLAGGAAPIAPQPQPAQQPMGQ